MPEVKLQNKEKIANAGVLNTETGALVQWERSDHGPSKFFERGAVGYFSHLGDKLAALYCLKGQLRFWVDGDERVIDEHTRVYVGDHSGQNTLRVETPSMPDLTLEYPPPDTVVPLEFDFTPGVELEHFDFGVFLRNIVAEPGRRLRMIHRLSGLPAVD